MNFAFGPRGGYETGRHHPAHLGPAQRVGRVGHLRVGDKEHALRLDLDVTAVSGSGTVHVQIETRALYGSGDWRVVDAFPSSPPGSVRRTMAGCDRFVRVVYTITGTGVTFSLTGEAV